MKYYLIYSVFLLANCSLFAQLFEGKIIYKVEYQNNKTQARDVKLEEEQGTQEEFFIKNGDYLIRSSGTINEWKLYKSHTNFIYEKHRHNDTLYVTNAEINTDTVHKINYLKKYNEKDTLKLEEYLFHCSSGSQYFYFNKKYKMDASHFDKHSVNHLNLFLKKSASVPLIQVYETHTTTYEKIAEKIEPQKLDASLFLVPKQLIIKMK